MALPAIDIDPQDSATTLAGLGASRLGLLYTVAGRRALHADQGRITPSARMRFAGSSAPPDKMKSRRRISAPGGPITDMRSGSPMRGLFNDRYGWGLVWGHGYLEAGGVGGIREPALYERESWQRRRYRLGGIDRSGSFRLTRTTNTILGADDSLSSHRSAYRADARARRDRRWQRRAILRRMGEDAQDIRDTLESAWDAGEALAAEIEVSRDVVADQIARRDPSDRELMEASWDAGEMRREARERELDADLGDRSAFASAESADKPPAAETEPKAEAEQSTAPVVEAPAGYNEADRAVLSRMPAEDRAYLVRRVSRR